MRVTTNITAQSMTAKIDLATIFMVQKRNLSPPKKWIRLKHNKRGIKMKMPMKAPPMASSVLSSTFALFSMSVRILKGGKS